MPVFADVEPAVVVTLIAGAVLVAVIAVALITVAKVLHQISARLEQIVGQVGEMPPKVAPAEEVLTSINTDLKAGQDMLEGLLASKGVQTAQPQAAQHQ